ncbi:deoxyribose-phosphate aldolase [Corynebacterium pacaense]|uniref:deoxyribose-phosphate aldolase n=1 Tax=Corynebacterium pacaense TaxID=1816684 RepID=UPI0009BC6D22|nr:deoxyribose-phosphate aldolase [Corynebacterium pacaense]
MSISRSELAAIIDNARLGPEVTPAEIDELIGSSLGLGVGGIWVPASMVGLTRSAQERGLRVGTVAGFPHGKSVALIKAAEARFAVQNGASAIGVVPDIAAVKVADENALLSEMVAVREAVPSPVLLTVIIEAAVLDERAITVATRAARAAGADFVATSTGFHPAGGASPEAVKMIAAAAQGLIGVTASGGIATFAQAEELVRAGATRILTSGAGEILGP